MSSGQTITLDAQKALAFVQGILPILEASIPAVGAASNPIGLGISGAAILLPLVADLIAQLEAKGIISPDEQQARLAKVEKALTDFSGPEWRPSGQV